MEQTKTGNLLIDTNESINFQSGETIFREGDKVDGLFFIEKGKVKVYRTDADGEEEILRIAEKGDFVGYRGFLTDTDHEASAKALEPTLIILIRKEKFRDAMES